MELNSIKDAFDHVTKKQKLSSSKSQEVIEQIGQEIEQALSRLQSEQDSASPSDHKLILNELKTKLKEIAPLSQTINQIIASHFYREGRFDLGDCFVNESNEQMAAANKAPFLGMFQILEALKSRDLEAALNWATRNHEQLNQNGSEIELKLRRLQFVEILQNRGLRVGAKGIKRGLNPEPPLAAATFCGGKAIRALGDRGSGKLGILSVVGVELIGIRVGRIVGSRIRGGVEIAGDGGGIISKGGGRVVEGIGIGGVTAERAEEQAAESHRRLVA